MTARIAVVGSCNIDLTTFTDRLPEAGETIFGNRFDLGFGGKGANQAVAARRCGADVQMVARVGRDLFGEATLRNFESVGVGSSYVQLVDGVSSGVAPIFVDPQGQNRIVVVKGANDTLLPADVDAAAADLIRADCIVLQFEIPLQTVEHTVRFARRHGVRTIVNPAPALPIDLHALEGVGYLIPNETEAEALTGMAVRTKAEAERFARSLVDRGIETVIITLGERGAFVARHGCAELVPPFRVTARDTTGAGDAFIGSFATFLAEGTPEREAVAKASLYAAISTTGIGTQKSFCDRTAFDAAWASRKSEV